MMVSRDRMGVMLRDACKKLSALILMVVLPAWVVFDLVEGFGTGYFIEIVVKIFITGCAGYVVWSVIWDLIPGRNS